MDDAAFEQAWRTHGPSIVRYCRFATGCEETGEDIAVETFARLLQSKELPADKLEAWLFTVARNLIRSHFRRATLWRSIEARVKAERREQATRDEPIPLADLLSPLRPNERLAVYLRVVEGRPFADVARLIGTSEDAAKKRVHRSLARLRSAFGEADPLEGGAAYDPVQ